MKNLVYCFMLIGALSMATSCMEEVDSPMAESQVNETGTNKVSFIIEDFVPEGQTKSAAQITESGINFQWSENDIIGIFPEKGWQTEFAIEDGAGSNVAVFDGGSWGLKQDATYYAYYPFSHENFETKEKSEQVSYSYEGQEACFADANGVVDLSKYDFMASGASTVENGAVNFRFKHLGALCRVSFEAPATATYSSIIIEAEEAIFPIAGYYDATDKDSDGSISLTAGFKLENHFTILFPDNNKSFNSLEQIECYFLMPPIDLSGKKLTFKLLDSNSRLYESALSSKNIVAGRSYSWDVSFDLYSGPETANCYQVSQSGNYSFPAVRGNDDSYIMNISSVEILWETYGTDVAPNKGDLISSVSYNNSQISYTVSSPFKEGNAVIAAINPEGEILWSWHIWLTDKPVDQIYNNNAGTMMDRNLGATSATPGDAGALGLLYQWGRKDPFLGAAEVGSKDPAKSTLNSWPSPVSSNESTSRVSYTTAHPTTFITNYDVAQDSWQSVKTKYDPCPVGYRVPDYDIWNIALDMGLASNIPVDYDHSNFGINLGKNAVSTTQNKYLTEDAVCWYPASGYINSSGSPSLGFYGYYWSCSPYDINKAYCLYFYNSSRVYSMGSVKYAFGHSVRCQKEK